MNEIKEKAVSFYKKNKHAVMFWTVAAIAGTMIFRGVMQLPQIHKNKQTIASLEEKIEYEGTRQKEIDELKDKVDTDEYIEKIAFEKLGLVKSNAKIFIDVSEGQ